MKKQLKEQLLKSAEYIAGVADSLEELLRGLSNSAACDVLAQMQELAIQIGNAIEDSEGAEHETVKKLESACEVLYQISCSLDEPETSNKLKVVTKNRKGMFLELKDLLTTVKEEIEKNIQIKLEVLFLPYQISMWDSLESVWMAAKEDESVETYVVPIPFYEVLPDNSLGALHYEGDKYPDYVPVTPYWQYSIEERKPDVIFFHNPYDGYNRVTRIPEKYYSQNIKKYTNLLVYIPYFVSEEGGLSEHQCYLPGVLFADRVVVQPGSIYEKYCRVYTDVVKQNGWENVLVPAEEKFLPLGSPKFDKVLSTACAVEKLPQEWQKVILKPDGSKKKIILYNLSIVPFLQSKERVLKKMDNVFSFFRENREELVLLWRPHPLLLNTFDSMLPWLKEEYLKRVRQFKEEGWGIYDETPDPNLAMALSDGYYGDQSSLVTSYRELGKPILLQDVDLLD